MSYDIVWKVRVEDTDLWVSTGEPDCCNITWNVGEIIRSSTGLEWKNVEDNGLVKDVMPKIIEGLKELTEHPEKYKPFEPHNKYGNVEDTAKFFEQLINQWEAFCEDSPLKDYVHFWIE